jgi:dTDP-4-amino-4,6-dideoxygalactose transaminase
MPPIPFADLTAQHRALAEELEPAIRDVIRECAFIRGPRVEAFEREFAAAIGAPHCVSCGNGTDALFIIFKTLGLQPGDEVITTAHSWIATSETITLAGGRVVFCDTDPDTFTISPSEIERKITPRTKGIVPVHLFGHPADMPAILDIARRHGLWVVEDCAQAHLARCHGQTVGTFGAAAAFSFYPGKNLGAMGDAGAIITNDGDLARRMAMFARHGGLRKGEHFIEGINSRMDGLQAAILSVKLRHLGQWTRERQRVAADYDRQLAGIPGIRPPNVAEGCEHVYHLYVIRVEQGRDDLRAFLANREIQTHINYPVILPLLPAYERLGGQPGEFPVAHGHQHQILSLPMFPEMTTGMVAAVAEAVREWAGKPMSSPHARSSRQ